ncbi:Protoporphyrinogen IX dehydrogenase [menaquinone] [Rubripirellula tenax]|uniref:Protoporphyrinogen IX dehydrogenase [menaquinone] n=1 Tax=Rubripirellula tenax TaxID=2528015 RepID=A0A5C6ECC8_9BACT|nr:Protoporphyrinogen IX dehydrogenase [menaquinone] [Rubripirellula tenax]
MAEHGVPTDTFDVTKHDVTGLAVDSYQAVVFGSSLHFAEHDSRIAWCIRNYRSWLRDAPSAFFSVSLGIISKNHKDRREAAWLADEFLRQEDFTPSRKACFAGALRYSQYGSVTKHLMHWIAKKSGSDTDTDRDYDYTDWPAIEAFASDFASLIHSCRQPDPSGPRFNPVDKPHRQYSARLRQSVGELLD